MRTISFILSISAVIQIALTAPALEQSTTTITPLGPMDFDQLVERFRVYKFHRYDAAAPTTINLIKSLLAKLDDIIASPDNSDGDNEIYQQFRNHYADYLKDVEDDTLVCSLKQVGHYYHHRIRDFVKSTRNVKVKDMFKLFNSDQEDSLPDTRKSRDDIQFIFDNILLVDKVDKNVKFGTRCCKYWHESYHEDIIIGKC